MSSHSKTPLCKLASWRPLVLAALLSLALAGCTGAPSVLDPASPQASSIAGLFWGLLGLAALIFVLVESLLIIAIVRFRDRPGSAEPAQIHGNWPLETTWTLIPALILTGVFVATASTMITVTQRQQDPLRVHVRGHQWWWEAEYPDQKIMTANEVHVPAGQPVEVELQSADVIHSFWVPRLAGKLDVIPGRSNVLRFEATAPGVYRGQCAEFCGDQHANMSFLVIADTREQFDAWVEGMQTPPAMPTAGAAARGAQAFGTQPCWTCHTIEGTKGKGKVGPNLTHVASRRTLAAVTLDNTPENLARWLQNPQAIKPGNKMPDLHLSQETTQDLVAYLSTLR